MYHFYTVSLVFFVMLTFVFTVERFDMPAYNFKQAEEACNNLASGASVKSFDRNEVTCTNGAVLQYKGLK